jgi:Na+/melibiose symporter-like transporter
VKVLHGARFFLYALSFAGYALILISLAAGGVAFFRPPAALVKSGLPLFLPPDLPGRFPLLGFVGLGGLLAFAAAAPAAAAYADRSRAGTGGRRAMLLAGLPLLTLAALLFFLPPAAGSSPVNAVPLFVYSVAAGTGAALSLASYHALGYEKLPAERERALLAALQTACLLGGGLLVALVLPRFFTSFSGFEPAGSFQWSYLLLILPSAALASASFFATTEKRSGPATEPALRRRETLVRSAARSLHAIFAFRPFSRLLRAEALASFALATLALGALPVGRDLMLADVDSLRLAVIVFLSTGLLVLPFLGFLTSRLGKKRTVIAGLGGLTGGLFLLALTGLAPNDAGLRWNRATAAAQGRDGEVYIGTPRGVSRFAAGAWSQVTRRDGLIDDRVNSITADDRGVWFATEGGASFFDGRTWTHFSQASGLADNRVLALLPRGGAVWFLTPAAVSLLDNSQWVHFAPPPSERANPAVPLTAFAVGPAGELWVGTAAGAFRLDESGWTEFTAKNGLKDDTITSLAFDADGAVLIGTYRGVARFLDGTWSYLGRAEGLPSEAVRLVKPSPDGRLFVATDAGVFVGSGALKRVLTRADGLASDRVDDILIARDGSVWFATGDGVSVLEAGGTWSRYQYALPWIWGLALAVLLAFPAALLLSLPRVFVVEAAEAYREKAGVRQETLCFAALLLVRAASLVAAGIVGAGLLYGGGESIANPLPARIFLCLGALAGGAAIIFYCRIPARERRKK